MFHAILSRLRPFASELLIFGFVVALCGGLILRTPRAYAADTGTPRIEAGKTYEAIYSCTTTPFLDDQGALQPVKGCYGEAWLVKAVGQEGWLRIVDLTTPDGTEWYVNVNRLSAIREHVRKPVTPPASVAPHDRVQAPTL